MYRELTEKNNNRIGTKNNTYNKYETHISFKLRLLRTSLLCLIIFSFGLFIAYQNRDRLISFDCEISKYFGIFLNADRYAFFDCMIKISFKDFFVLLLLLLSALTFFCDAMTNILLTLCGLFLGICSGALIFVDTVSINELLYIVQAVALIVLFIFVSHSATSFNRAFIGKRSAAEPYTPSVSPLMAKYILRAVVYIFIYLVIKAVYCIFQLAIQ